MRSKRKKKDRTRRKRKVRYGDDRFALYLSGSLQSARPLKHERRIQRNKAILMLLVVLLLLFWVLYRFFL
jgi:hypothetical protein